MPEDEKVYRVEYKVNTLKPPLTRAEMVKARKDYPSTGFAEAAIVLARLNSKTLIVETAPGEVFGQTQFEMWLQFTEQLSRGEDVPVAMRIFLSRVLNEYKAELCR